MHIIDHREHFRTPLALEPSLEDKMLKGFLGEIKPQPLFFSENQQKILKGETMGLLDAFSCWKAKKVGLALILD